MSRLLMVIKRSLLIGFAGFWTLLANAQFVPMGQWNQSSITGFGTNGTGWLVTSSNISSAPIASDVLTLADGSGSSARCAFWASRLGFQSGFTANYTYTPSGTADGAAFVIQNDSRGATALGGPGGGLGYNGIASSMAVELNIYSGATGGAGYMIATNGGYGSYSSTGPISVSSGDPIRVTVNYVANTSTLTLSLLDLTTSQTFSTSTSSVNLVSQLGGTTGFVGFCGATGGFTSTQTISNFQFRSF